MLPEIYLSICLKQTQGFFHDLGLGLGLGLGLDADAAAHAIEEATEGRKERM